MTDCINIKAYIRDGVYTGPPVWDGDIIIRYMAPVDFSKLVYVTGQISVSLVDYAYFSDLVGVGKSVTFSKVDNVELPALAYIGGDFRVEASHIGVLHSLTSIGSDLFIRNNSNVDLANLRTVGGFIKITDYYCRSIPELVLVRGGAEIAGPSLTELPKLEVVFGKLDLFGSGVKELPNIKSIGNLVTNSLNLIFSLRGAHVGAMELRGKEYFNFLEEFGEFKGIPLHDLVLHTGNKSPLIKEAVEIYLRSFQINE